MPHSARECAAQKLGESINGKVLTRLDAPDQDTLSFTFEGGVRLVVAIESKQGLDGGFYPCLDITLEEDDKVSRSSSIFWERNPERG